MDVENVLLGQNLVLGRIEAKIENTISLQTAANGRTSKLEAKVDLLVEHLEERSSSLKEEFNKKIHDLESSKSEVMGAIKAIQAVGSILVISSTIFSIVFSHFWK